MNKYRKKPVEVEAIQFVGDFASYNKVKEFAKENIEIKGVKGEFYPCKPDVFKKTYEKVEQF